MCGPGDPENFLYRGTRNPDGTRAGGDQLEIINKLEATGANSIYFAVIRSHGGDGDSTHNPFIDSDPNQGISTAILDQWETWFTEMDSHGIVIFLVFYDDSARIWDSGNNVGDAERELIQTIVNYFEHHKHLIWVVAEEYSERYTAKRVSNIAAEIRLTDDYDHVIAVHKRHGVSFSEFAADPNIDQFAIQYNVDTASELHSGMVTAWNNAAGRYNLNMSETLNHGIGVTARKKNWAIAMGGAYVMFMGWFLDWYIADPPVSDLEDCGRLVTFMESTNFNEMAPHDELKFGGTEYVLAFPGNAYIAYASNLSGSIGLKNMIAGTYRFKWYDVTNGNTIIQDNIRVAAGDQTWIKPQAVGNELAVYITRTGGTTNVAPTAHSQDVTVTYETAKDLTLTYTDFDGPGPYSFQVSQGPLHGTVVGDGPELVYTPTVGYIGSDSFQWQVNDGIDNSNVATVSINIPPPQNQPPSAEDKFEYTIQDEAVYIQLNYSDPDGPGPFSFSIVQHPAHAALSGTGNDVTYTPNSSYVGGDSFTWNVSDGLDVSNLATVAITVLPASQVLISNLSAVSGRSYAVTYSGLQNGLPVYVDRDFIYSYVPTWLESKTYIRTANDDKTSSGNSFISFNVNQAVTVYVAHDNRISTKPSWLTFFSDTGDDLVTTDTTLDIYARDFPSGTVVLGGNEGTAESSMYVVIVVPKGDAPLPDTTPPARPTGLSVFPVE